MNPNSLEVLTDARVESHMQAANPLERFQFERVGYFCVDLILLPGRLVFNRTVPLRDSWAKIQEKLEQSSYETGSRMAPSLNWRDI